jgi:hypothetical protein
VSILSNSVLFLLQRRGTDVTLSKPSYGSYDPATGTFDTTSSTDYTVKCYFANYALSEIDNNNVVMGDRKAYLPSTDTSGAALPAPDQEDTISGLGDTVKVVRVQELYSQDNLVCYICQVRE